MVQYCTPLNVSNFMGLKRDQARVIAGDANSAQKDIDMGSAIVHYSVGDQIIIYDDDSPVGESLTVASIAGTTITCTTNLVNSYTQLSNGKVENQSHFTPRTLPSKEMVEEVIEMNEDDLDRELHTSFKSTGQKVEEFVTIMLGRDKSFPYYAQPLSYSYNWRYPIRLDNRNILPFDKSQGDFLFVQIGGDWKDLLDPKNGYKVWESVVDKIVEDEDLSAGTPITCTLSMQPRLATPLKWKLSHSNITEFDLEFKGYTQDGTAITETFDETDGWEGYTTEFFNSITSIKVTAITGLGTDDTLDVTTEKESSRESSDYDIWVDYDQGVTYPISLAIDTGHKTVRVGYRRGYYSKEYETIPGDIKKACIYKTAIDLLLNERYALNLPRSNVSTLDVEKTIQNWESRLRRIVARRREIVGGVYYQ